MGEGIHTIKVKTDRSALRDTDRGLNRQEAFRVSQLESKIRNRKTEKGYVIGENGNVIAESVKGTAHQAKFRVSDLKGSENGVLTHNHPTEGADSGLYGTLAGRIGLPFSAKDVNLAAEYNLKEIRAVTPTYTYSIRRPKGGWGDKAKIESALRRYQLNAQMQAMDYAVRQGAYKAGNQRRKEISDRANVGTQYTLLKKLAKDMGWEFTRRRVK